jgi:NYN domain
MTTAAIFIDLDNFYIRASENVDAKFAITLIRDIDKLIKGLRRYDKLGGGRTEIKRDFVVQKVYAPENIWNRISTDHSKILEKKKFDFRKNFESSKFDVVFCPELTGEGKNSADIKLACDAQHILKNHPNIDEFFIFACDSDYFPLIQEIRKNNTTVYYLKFPIGTARKYQEHADWLGANSLDVVDFYLLLDSLKLPSASLSSQDQSAIDLLKPELEACADARQGFVPNSMVSEIIDARPDIKNIINWDIHYDVNRFLEHISSHCKSWMRVDNESQGIRIPNHRLDISAWNVDDEFREFVIRTIVEINDPILFFPPSVFEVIFRQIAHGIYRQNSLLEIVQSVISSVLQTCGILIEWQEVLRIVGLIVQRQNGQMTAEDCADIWRLEIYSLSRGQKFLKQSKGRRFLCNWYSVDGEDINAAVRRLHNLMDDLD